MDKEKSDSERKRKPGELPDLFPAEPINSAPPPENTADIRAELREISGTPSCDEPLVSFCEARSDPRLLGNLADRRRRQMLWRRLDQLTALAWGRR